jgi:hypothetical protein
MWYAQVSSTLKGAEVWGYVTGTKKAPSPFITSEPAADAAGKAGDPVPNPDYAKWVARINRS